VLSLTGIAKGEETAELFEKFNSLPFDDRVNREAKIEDISNDIQFART
jgi:ATP-dependent DNA helicase RecG